LAQERPTGDFGKGFGGDRVDYEIESPNSAFDVGRSVFAA